MTIYARVAENLGNADPEDLIWLDLLCEANAYYCPQIMPRRRYAVIHPFMFSWGIIVGDLGDDSGYSDRWCFKNFHAAATSLDIWARGGFTGEPHGWHRHPDSGRRRPGGDESKEYVNR